MVKTSFMRILNIIVIILLSFSLGKAQSAKRDTLYYLLDTLAVSAKDRLFSYEAENANIKWVTINCPCLEHGVKPEFRINVSNQKIVERNWLKAHNTVSFPYLLNYLHAKDKTRLISHFDIFFIEPYDDHSFKINKAVFAGGLRIINDIIILK